MAYVFDVNVFERVTFDASSTPYLVIPTVITLDGTEFPLPSQIEVEYDKIRIAEINHVNELVVYTTGEPKYKLQLRWNMMNSTNAEALIAKGLKETMLCEVLVSSQTFYRGYFVLTEPIAYQPEKYGSSWYYTDLTATLQEI